MKTLITAVWACAREKGIAEEAMRDILRLRTGKESLKACTRAELVELIEAMRGEVRYGKSGWSGTKRGKAMHADGARGAAGSTVLVNERELLMVRETASRLGWGDVALAKFVERQTGRGEIRTMGDLNKVMRGLRSIERRRSG